ncbi:MAG: DUF748 domain-containing protein [Sulfurimonas sp.]|jgi:uncharacterized protein involved in outer membrane biogenesis/outer membrane protein OmpA-like peptidoglycan-associated protein
MKKRFWAYGALAAVSVYAAAGFLGVPYLLKNSVPDKVATASNGGRLSIESSSFNPFTLRLCAKKISFKTPNNSDFVAVEQLIINVDLVDYLSKKRMVIDTFEITNPHIMVQKDSNGTMNFGWLLGNDETNETKEPSKPLPLSIHNFTLKEGVIEYFDQSEGRDYHQKIPSLGFHLENIDLKDISNNHGLMRLYATMNEGGFIDLRGKISEINPFAIDGSVAIDSGELSTFWSYFKDKLPIEVTEGKLGLRLDYALNTDDINATKLSHLWMNVDNVHVVPNGAHHNLLRLESLKLENGTVFPLRKELKADRFSLNGLDVSASRSRTAVIDWLDYIEQINKAFPEDENETKVPWKVMIGDVNLENMGVTWSDHQPKIPYSATMGGITLSSQQLSIDPKKLLNGQLNTGKVEVHTLRDSKKIASLESIAVEGLALNREAQNTHIQNVSINGATTSFKRLKDGTIDLQQLIAPSPNTKTQAKKSEEKPWHYRVDNFGVNNGKIGFIDTLPSQNIAVNIDNLFLDVKGFSSNPKETMIIESRARINEKTTLKIASKLRRETLQSTGNFELTHFPLPLIDPYIEPSSYAALRRGDLGIKGIYSFTLAKTSVAGKLSLNDWVVEDRRDKSVVLGWNRIGVTPFKYAYPDNRLKINHLSVEGLYTNILIDQNKTVNFSTLGKAPKSDTNESNATTKGGNTFGLDIVKLAVSNSSATFSDLSLPLPFKTTIHDLSGEVLGISTTQNVSTIVKLRGGVDAYGLAKIDGSLNTKDPKGFTDMHVAFENLELKNYTPYSLQFMGYKIADGRLFLNLGYKITQGALNAQNNVVIKKIALGEEIEGGAKWPMKLVVALLEDSEGVIDIDLPIEGNVTDPNFRYGKVVWQVIGNLFTKAVTSPFRLLGSLMGMNSEDDALSKVSFEEGEVTVSPPMREKLDKLATVMAKRPKLFVTVHGGYATQEDTHALQVQKLITTIIAQHPKQKLSPADAISVENLEFMAKKQMAASQLKDLRITTEKKYPQEAEFIQNYTASLIEKLSALQIVTKEELESLGDTRAKTVADCLSKDSAVASRISIGTHEKSSFNAKEGISTRLELTVR